MRRPSPAFVLALIALMVALSGTGYAATKITSKDVKNNSLTGADIRNGTVGTADLKRGVRRQLSVAGPKGDQGSPGPQGIAGPQGPPGLAGVEVVSGAPVPLPSGSANNGSIECPAGKVAIAGGVAQTNASGVEVLSTAGTNISLVRSNPSSPTRWTAGVENTGTTDRFFKVTVICATVDP